VLNELHFNGAPVVVTGAGSGIGQAAATVLGELGAHVVVTDLVAEKAAETEKQLTGSGVSCEAHALDVTDAKAITSFADAVAAKHGFIKSLINNAGFAQFGTATDLTDEAWQGNVTLNLTSVFRMSKAFLPLLMQSPNGGSIVNTASIFAFMAFPGTAVYAATKGGVVSLTRQMAADYGKQGVRINCVCPGGTLTPAVKHDIEMGYATEDQIKGRMLIDRMADPLEIGNAIAFLASDASSFITATALQIDGGQSLG
jgi:NAD(P)-dependent dehydrogenase (short-subunit alcohol dehydrogenase family)